MSLVSFQNRSSFTRTCWHTYVLVHTSLSPVSVPSLTREAQVTSPVPLIYGWKGETRVVCIEWEHPTLREWTFARTDSLFFLKLRARFPQCEKKRNFCFCIHSLTLFRVILELLIVLNVNELNPTILNISKSNWFFSRNKRPYSIPTFF